MADRKKDYDAVIDSPLGRLGIQARDVLTSIDFISSRTRRRLPRTPLARRVCTQLKAYFDDPKNRFHLPLAPGGTPFQQNVWRAMQRIPVGRVRRYGDLAKDLKSAARAVGGACRANPIPIVIPCHRVISATGLGGFMGATQGRALGIKRWLLAHERTD
ncbi:MAG TPA: cysteine methyltransferase [Gammaproteobacteria bacterium]|nr:cysteine methyltransferase [Gammaproteobacteria bacterium]